MSLVQGESWLDAFLLYTQNVEAPTTFRLWTGISVISAALQRKVWVNFADHLVTIYPNLYVVLTAPPGVCRKSTIIGIGERMLRRLQGPLLLANDITREKMLREMRENPVEALPDKEIPRHHSATCIAGEFSTLLGTKDVDMLITLTNLWDAGELYKYSTKTSGEDELPNFYLTILAGTTPQWISTSLPKEAIGGGFTSRIVFVCETRRQKSKSLTAEVIDSEALELEDPLMEGLKKIFLMKGEAIWTPEAGDWYTTWYEGFMKSEPSIPDIRFHDYLFGRKPALVWKTSLCISASEGSLDGDTIVVETEALEQALGMLDDLETDMPHAFGGYGQSELSEVQYQVWQVIDKNPGITAEGVMSNLLWEIKDRLQFMMMASNLKMAGRIYEEPDDDVGVRYYSKRG